MALSSKIEVVRGVETPSVSWWQTENTWSSNSYLVSEGRTLYIVDSGLGSFHRTALMRAVARFPDADRVYLFNTHWHLDHSGNGMIVGELGEKFNEVHYLIPKAAKEDMERSGNSILDMGLGGAEWLRGEDKEEFDFGGVSFRGWGVVGAYLLLTPGHSLDSVSIYLKGGKAIFTGDLLWYVNPNALEGSIETLLQSIAKLKSLVREEGIDYLGEGHFQPISGRENILDYISEYEEKEKTLLSCIREAIASRNRVSVNYLLEKLRESDHPAIKEALRINHPYYPSYLHRFTRVFLREKGWQQVDKGAGGTWERS